MKSKMNQPKLSFAATIAERVGSALAAAIGGFGALFLGMAEHFYDRQMEKALMRFAPTRRRGLPPNARH
jgi:hypothetical protein